MSAAHDRPADIVLVGAGLAGATAASVLARQGLRVILVDARDTYPPCFKAEKIEPDQAELFRKFGLMEALLPWTGRIREILDAQNGRVLQVVPIDQYGIFYHDMVNAVRRNLPPTVDLKIGRVREIVTGPDQQRVILAGGQECTARLVAITSGTGGDLHSRLGLKRQMVQKDQSLAFGFTIVCQGGGSFPFDAVTYYPGGCATGVAYLTLFLIGEAMRANLFVFWSVTDERARKFMREPRRELLRCLPGLRPVIGEFDVAGKVEAARIDLYRSEQYLRPGLVLLADAFQSVCPTTGSGLSKVLTDVDVLCHECLPQWLATPGMGVEKIARFYENPRKQQVDRSALLSAGYQRRMGIDASLPWGARRLRQRLIMEATGWRDYFRLTRKLTA